LTHLSIYWFGCDPKLPPLPDTLTHLVIDGNAGYIDTLPPHFLKMNCCHEESRIPELPLLEHLECPISFIKGITLSPTLQTIRIADYDLDRCDIEVKFGDIEVQISDGRYW